MKKIEQGATIGVIAPAGPTTLEKVEGVAPWLEARGFKAKLFPSVHHTSDLGGYLAGSDARRVGDLHAAFADPAVDAIICLRGGYGTARLLDRIDFHLVQMHAKPFVGYSDITSLHIAFNQKIGMPTIHAPMLASDFVGKDESPSVAALFDLLRDGFVPGRALQHTSPELRTVNGGRAQGKLMGGNLSVICASLGTPWAIDARDGILFLEEIAEEPYRIDRMLTQLRHAGVLAAARGFVVGSFTEADDPSEVIAEILAPLGKPMVTGFQAGHCVPNFALPFGVDVAFDADAGSLSMV